MCRKLHITHIIPENPKNNTMYIQRERQMDAGQAQSSKSVKAERTAAGISISPSIQLCPSYGKNGTVLKTET